MSRVRVVAAIAAGLLFAQVGVARAAEKLRRKRVVSREVVADSACKNGEDATIWISPREPVAGSPVRVFAVAANGAAGELSAFVPGGKPVKLTATVRGSSPASLSAEIAAPRAGRLMVQWLRGDKPVACRGVDVVSRPDRPSDAGAAKGAWAATGDWDRRAEDFYSAWIERLFDAPVDGSLDFRPLHQALRDPARNFLYGYLGLGEDDPKNKAAVPATPDCADLPFYLRAYFAWKLGLPVGFHDCDRGADTRPPKCTAFATNEDALAAKDKGELGRVKAFLRLMSNHVQSGSARTALDDSQTDYYPVRLERKALRPSPFLCYRIGDGTDAYRRFK